MRWGLGGRKGGRGEEGKSGGERSGKKRVLKGEGGKREIRKENDPGKEKGEKRGQERRGSWKGKGSWMHPKFTIWNKRSGSITLQGRNHSNQSLHQISITKTIPRTRKNPPPETQPISLSPSHYSFDFKLPSRRLSVILFDFMLICCYEIGEGCKWSFMHTPWW